MKNNMNNKLMDAIGGIGDGYVENITVSRAERAEEKPGIRRLPRRAWLAAAVCAALLVCLGVGTYVYAEGAEYNEARTFFEENGLSAEGLTRAEVKAVYRDITEESFTYSKTAEVLEHSIKTGRVNGWDFSGDWDELDQSAVKELWDAYDRRRNSEGVRYYTSLSYIHHDEGDGWNEETGSYIEKYDGMTLLWKAEFDGIYAEDYVVCDDGLFVYGQAFDEKYNSHTWLIRLDGTGKILWKHMYGDENETVCSALLEEDVSFTLFSHPGAGVTGYCFGRIGSDGSVIERKKTLLDDQLLSSAVHYCGGYLAKVWDYSKNGEAAFVRIDRDGDIQESFSYSSEEDHWFLNDMIEYNGMIYISVLAMPKEGTYIIPEHPDYVNQRHCVQPTLEYAFTHWSSSEDGEYPYEIPGLTEKVRERCTALLLVLGPDGGEPKEFYSAEGGIGAELSVNEKGELVWNVKNILGTYFSPATSAFTIAGSCRVVQYRFNEDGNFIGQTETDEICTVRW